jgi:hypothetical protein
MNKGKMTRIATVISKGNNIDAQMAKYFKRKYQDHEISYAAVKRFKAIQGSLGNPRIARQKDPTSYMLHAFGRGNSNSPAQLLKMRAQHPNILVPESSWNDQVEQIRASLGCTNTFCTQTP